jgi:hypothetical protein
MKPHQDDEGNTKYQNKASQRAHFWSHFACAAVRASFMF